jgi:hypothetical protein
MGFVVPSVTDLELMDSYLIGLMKPDSLNLNYGSDSGA